MEQPHRTARTHVIGLFASALLALLSLSGCAGLPRPIDTCAPAPGPARVSPLHDLPAGSQIRAAADAVNRKNIVLIVNGNGFPAEDYTALADHLAHNGFIAAIIRRPGGHGGDDRFILEAARTVLETLGLRPEDPAVNLALVGHSVAGTLVVNAAATAAAEGPRLPVRAVVALAPSALNSAHLDGNAAESYLLIYGSQDEDLTGFSHRRREAFRAYDLAGSEYSSTCDSPPDCFFKPPRPFEKTMIYIHGADHAGLVGANRAAGGNLPRDTEYVTPADQLCVVKTYVAGFLRWKLMGEARFRPLVRGASEPPPVAGITTAEADARGRPADSPLELEFQVAPAQRRVIENFQGGPGDYSHSRKAFLRHADAGELSGDDHYVRHDTGLALVGWEGAAAVQWTVPEGARDGRSYTHFAFRAGQLHAAPEPYSNPENAGQAFRLGLEDGAGAISWHAITRIAPPDAHTDAPSKAVSHMQTVRVPLEEVEGIDLEDVRYLHLRFETDTRGTLLFDNFEWHRDSPFIVNPRPHLLPGLPAELALPPGHKQANKTEDRRRDAEDAENRDEGIRGNGTRSSFLN